MPPDFLNSREDAILLWALVLLAFVTYKDPRGISTALFSVLRSALHPKLVLLFGATAAYSAAVVSGLRAAGLWDTTALKPTIYWFAGTAVVLGGVSVSRASPSDPELWRRVRRRIVAVALVIEVVVNLYAFPFVVEAVMQLLVLLFIGMQAVSEGGLADVDDLTRRFINVVLALLGFVYLGYFLVRAFSDLNAFLTREHAQELLIGPALTIALIPLLYAFAWLSRREQENFRKRWRSTFNSPA